MEAEGDKSKHLKGRLDPPVSLSRKMITLPNGLKSSSLVVAISFFKHCNYNDNTDNNANWDRHYS